MTDKTFDSNFKRLIATLIAEDSFPNSVREAQRKVADSLLLFVNNKPRTPSELSDLAERLHFLRIQADELDAVFANDRYVKHETQDEYRYSLRSDVFADLKAVSGRDFGSYVALFCKRHPQLFRQQELSPSDVENTIYSFLYRVTDENLSDLQKVADHTISAEPDSVVGQSFSENERQVINAFLDWDNPEKDRLVFRIANLGLEFCLMTNNSTFESLQEAGIASKDFFLDTNIIYRAIGLNGEGRKSRIRYFLNKCRESGQTLSISAFAEAEFFGSLSYHLERINERPSVNPEAFLNNSVNEDIYRHYYNWKSMNHGLGTDTYFARIRMDYDSLIDEYDISLVDESKIPFKEETSEISQVIHDYSRAIQKAKHNDPGDDFDLVWHSPKKDTIDAKNILLVETLRNGSAKSVAGTKHFMVSTDHRLIDWDHSRTHRVPIAMLPSQWLTILMAVSKRSVDDFAAFSSFIRMPETVTGPTSIQIAAVLDAIGHVTEDPTEQGRLYRNLIEAKANRIFKSKKIEKIAENAYEEAIKARDEEMNNLKGQLTESQAQATLLRTEYDSSQAMSQELNRTIETKKEENAALEARVRQLEDVRLVNRRIRSGISLMVLAGLCAIYFLLQVLGPDSVWNIPRLLVSVIDQIESPTIQNGLMTVNYAVGLGGALYLATIAWRSYLSRSARDKALERAHSEKIRPE